MKSRKFIEAYNAIEPSGEQLQRIYSRLTPVKKKSKLRPVLIAAACLVLFGSIGALATMEKWKLPAPTTYETERFPIQEQTEYEEIPETSEPLTDGAFMEKSVEILNVVGLEDVNTEAMTVTRQRDEYWNRNEVQVSFTRDDLRTELSFDADTGKFLRLSGIDYLEGENRDRTEEEVEALAWDYYQALPVEQDYQLLGRTVFDNQYWSYEFCKEYEDGLMNTYEMVRLGVNPVSGRLCGCNVFYIPLLDDHAPEDVPLTQTQAEEIAQSCNKVNLEGYTLTSAEKQIAMPNWWFTENIGANLQASNISRLCWVLTYEDRSSEFADIIEIDVDYYTGEILGGGQTG